MLWTEQLKSERFGFAVVVGGSVGPVEFLKWCSGWHFGVGWLLAGKIQKLGVTDAAGLATNV